MPAGVQGVGSSCVSQAWARVRRWVKLVKEKRDEQWSMQELVSALCNRRYSERTIVYVESHDQSIVGDQTLGAPPTFPRCKHPQEVFC